MILLQVCTVVVTHKFGGGEVGFLPPNSPRINTVITVVTTDSTTYVVMLDLLSMTKAI